MECGGIYCCILCFFFLQKIRNFLAFQFAEMGVLGWGECCLSLDDAAVNYCYQLKFVWIFAFVFSSLLLLVPFFFCFPYFVQSKEVLELSGSTVICQVSFCHSQSVWFNCILHTQANAIHTQTNTRKSFMIKLCVTFFICWHTVTDTGDSKLHFYKSIFPHSSFFWWLQEIWTSSCKT